MRLAKGSASVSAGSTSVGVGRSSVTVAVAAGAKRASQPQAASRPAEIPSRPTRDHSAPRHARYRRNTAAAGHGENDTSKPETGRSFHVSANSSTRTGPVTKLGTLIPSVATDMLE